MIAANLLMKQDWTEIERGFVERWHRMINSIHEDPWRVFNVISNAESLLPTADNERGKENKIFAGRGPDGVDRYMRLSFGKVPEEMLDIFRHPSELINRKLSPTVKAVSQLAANRDGINRPIYNPDSKSIVDEITKAATIAKYFVGAHISTFTDMVGAASDVATGHDPTGMQKLKLIGTMAGASFSHGNPKGREQGEIMKEQEHYEWQLKTSLPDIRKSIQNGDLEAATKMMNDIKVPMRDQNKIINSTLNPHASRKAVQNFMQRATPDVLEEYYAKQRVGNDLKTKREPTDAN